MSYDVMEAKFVRNESVPAPEGAEVWEMRWPDETIFARAEVYRGETQWGVRVQDRAPELPDRELISLVGRILIWEMGARVDTVEVVLGRTHEKHALVRVGGEYV